MAKVSATPAAEKMTIEQLEIEERKYRLQLLKEQVAKIQTEKDTNARNRKAQADTEERNRKNVAMDQARCKHKKGGRDVSGIFDGNSENYAVMKHTEPWGETYIKCQRCGKEVRDPFFMMRKLNPEKVIAFKKKNPARYLRAMKEYRRWASLPTDNSPSGSQIFNIQRAEDMIDELEEFNDDAEDVAA
jgi:hypothetical protein